LAVGRVATFEPVPTVSAVLAHCHDAFQTLFAHEIKQRTADLLEMSGEQNARMICDDSLKHFLSADQRQPSKIPALAHESIECIEDRRTTAAQQFIKVWLVSSRTTISPSMIASQFRVRSASRAAVRKRNFALLIDDV